MVEVQLRLEGTEDWIFVTIQGVHIDVDRIIKELQANNKIVECNVRPQIKPGGA